MHGNRLFLAVGASVLLVSLGATVWIFDIASGAVALVSSIIIDAISSSGYLGIVFLMAMESAVMPVPSEIVMPFSGYLVLQGTFDLWLVTLAGTAGNLIGSWAAYAAGHKLGRPAILKYGKYVLLRERHLVLAERWFERHGDMAIFFSRLMPVVRTVISLPAGVAKMNLTKFSTYTFVGSIPWNLALTYAGFWLGANWETLSKHGKTFDAIIVAGLAAVAIYFVLNRGRQK